MRKLGSRARTRKPGTASARRWAPLLVLLASCATSSPSGQVAVDPGLDDRLAWECEYATIKDGVASLQSPDGVQVAQIRQKLKTLKPFTNYTLSVRVRAASTPTAQLSVDLYLEDVYDNPDQELVVLPSHVGPEYLTFYRTINTGSFPEQPYLRVFTFSTVPMEVTQVSLVPAT